MAENMVTIARRPPGLSEATLRRAVGTVLRGEQERAPISLTFLGPTAMRRLNHRHLGHDRPTDVLSFALPVGGSVMGDVYVCRAIAAAEARRRQEANAFEAAETASSTSWGTNTRLYGAGRSLPCGRNRSAT